MATAASAHTSGTGAGPVGLRRGCPAASGERIRADSVSEGAWLYGGGADGRCPRSLSGGGGAACAGAGAAAAARLTWTVRVSWLGELRDWGATGRAGPSGPWRRRRYKAGDGEHVMSECGGRGGGSSSDDAEDEGGGGGGPAGSGSLSPAPAASSEGRLRRGLRGASLMARRRPELLCGAVALGCALLLALKFTCR